MDLYARTLNSSDATLMEEKYPLFLQDQGLKLTNAERELNEKEWRELYLDDSNHQFIAFGSFDKDNQLVATLQLFLWNQKPHGTLEHVQKFQQKKLGLNHIVPCYESMFDFLREKNIEVLYNFHSRERHQKYLNFYQRMIPSFQNWKTEEEIIVPAGLRPKKDFLFGIIGRRTWSLDLVIQKYVYFNSQLSNNSDS